MRAVIVGGKALFFSLKTPPVRARETQALFMYERLSWTYQLLMRIIEDIPQLLISLLFLLQHGRDVYVSPAL